MLHLLASEVIPICLLNGRPQVVDENIGCSSEKEEGKDPTISQFLPLVFEDLAVSAHGSHHPMYIICSKISLWGWVILHTCYFLIYYILVFFFHMEKH